MQNCDIETRSIRRPRIEWPTLGVLAGCYALWLAATALGTAAPWLAVPVLAVALTLHSSLQHEATHGHPTRNRRLNTALVFPALGLFVPYGRFRDTHMAHHRDERLTDPYDDPESNYLDPAMWHRLPVPVRAVLRANNTLLGRVLLGPAVSMAVFWVEDAGKILAGDRRVRTAWAEHPFALLPVIAWLVWVGFPLLPYLAAAYLGMGILKIRTFLEHRAHEEACGRTVIIEDRGPLAFLFLNNNFHAVHHMRPWLAWYELPGAYRAARGAVLARNAGYRYRSYAEVMRRFLLRAKDPVPHPLWRP
ncbi:MAG: fatty acid desaturase [Pseudomonadota bacterium]